jgi:hypothetical protein
LLLFGRLQRLSPLALFTLYLSLFHAGQLFMNFQWGYLLLESGFLAFVYTLAPNRLVIWLFHWVLFRLRFESGNSKLISGDTSWAELSALTHYFETQPLPHVGAWFAHQLPHWILSAGTGFVLLAKLLVPFLIFMPRRFRLFAAAVTLFTQLIILLTSNHNFFNLLTITLRLFLLTDRDWSLVLPRLAKGKEKQIHLPVKPLFSMLSGLFALIIVTMSGALLGEMVTGKRLPPWADNGIA